MYWQHIYVNHRKNSNLLYLQIIAERKLYHEQTNGQYLKNIDSDISVEEDDVKSIGSM